MSDDVARGNPITEDAGDNDAPDDRSPSAPAQSEQLRKIADNLERLERQAGTDDIDAYYRSGDEEVRVTLVYHLD